MFISPPPKRMDTFEWRKWLEQLVNYMNQAASAYRSLSVRATGLVVKAGPGRVYGWQITNIGAARVFVKLYNKATAATAADTPVLTIPVEAGGDSAAELVGGINFSAGISIRATTGFADADVTDPPANEVFANLFYI